jgi:hypothetical protein
LNKAPFYDEFKGINSMSQLDPIVNQPSIYMNGLLISNDATTPNTVLDISAGQCRDSNNIIDMVLGDFLNEGYSAGSANFSTSLNAAVNGLNGLDTGSLAASTMYAVYVIGDSSSKNPTGVILSANQATPGLPFGYDSYRKIGYWATDATSHFLAGYYSISGIGVREFFYDAPQATAITAGHATVATNVNLIKFVPNINNVAVWIYTSYVPATAGNALSMQPGNGTGFPIVITGQVATVAVTSQSLLLAQSVVISTVSSPVINYKESNASDAVAIDVLGFQFDADRA